MQKNAVSERLNTKYGSIIAKSFYMPKAMAKHISDTYDQVVDTRYAVLPFASIEDNQVKLTDEDYKNITMLTKTNSVFTKKCVMLSL